MCGMLTACHEPLVTACPPPPPPTLHIELSQYIDDQLLAAGFCYASINGHDGSLWACSKGYTVLPEEAIKLSELLGGSSLDSIASSGFLLAGQKYAYTRGEVDDDEGGVVRLGDFFV